VTASSDNWISQALSLGAINNFVRGLTVGASVLLLVRSKDVSVGNSEGGIEFAYNLGRAWILKSYNNERVIAKNWFWDGQNRQLDGKTKLRTRSDSVRQGFDGG
jgi:hypothetical protein